ncbi:MAG: hypothetical protein EAZ14_00060 [Runella slithyformis]|nr:MAG: hypothetical protein EAZ14_00060 [Runella slithyformis]
MKIIQSFWSNPAIESPLHNAAGWLSAEYHWMAWALSVAQLRQFYEEVELITDQTGKAILIDTLQLPYTHVKGVLDELNDYPSKLWALAKIHAYSYQSTPFLHVDGDVFIWEQFSKALLNNRLIVQNFEFGFVFYTSALAQLRSVGGFVPDYLDVINPHFLTCNAGIIGGFDTDFFKEYAQKVKTFARQNEPYLDLLDARNLNMLMEQGIFSALASQKHIPVCCQMQHLAIADSSYPGLANFGAVPHQTKFIHALGEFKRQPETCRHLARRLRQDHPEYYERIVEVCQAAGVEMDCRYYQHKPTEAYQAHYERDVRQYRAVQDLFGLPIESILHQNLYFSPHAQLLETTTEAGNLQQTLLLPDIFVLAEKSMVLDPLNMVLLDAFLEQSTCIEAAIAAAAPYFDQAEITADFAKFQQLALARLKELLYAGALEVETYF